MELALPTGLAILALVLLLWGRHIHLGRRRVEVLEGPPAGLGERATIVLDLAPADAHAAGVERLVREAAERVLAGSRDLSEVEVRSRTGAVLGRVKASAPAIAHPDYEPSLPQPRPVRRTPEPPGGLEDELRLKVTPHFDAKERPAPKRPLAEAFELTDSVRSRISDPDDPVEIVRAILDSAGLRASVEGDLIRCGEDAIVVIRRQPIKAFRHDVLNHAYLVFHDTGCARGLVIAFGYLDPVDIRRREMFEPALHHSGREAIQRMADAASIGADPLAFAVAPPVIATTRTRVEARA
jgi:hypothetical protein